MLLGNLLAKSAKAGKPKTINCDVLVIGGGSGGLACAQAAAKRGANVVMCDYVRPSETRNTVWGLGGTCVNVGCVPKKLFHRAGMFGQALYDGEMEAFGFGPRRSRTEPADWKAVVRTVQNHVKMLNFTYSAALPDNCTYLNGQAKFDRQANGEYAVVVDAEHSGKRENMTTVKATKAIVIAVGGRPQLPEEVPGAKQLGISSDDLFSLKTSPRKTLVIGSSYIGLETASFLNGIGCDTTVLVRSQPLRGSGFDRDCAEKLMELMQNSGVKVLRQIDVAALQRNEETKQTIARFSNGASDEFDTVMFGTGRRPETKRLNLPEQVLLGKDGKIKVDPTTFQAAASTNDAFPPIYAIGDCASTGAPELTPVAIRQGEIIATNVTSSTSARDEKRLRSLQFVPSTVFTLPSEYSRIGISEHDAIEQYGKDNVEVYVREWQPLETSAAHVKPLDEATEDAALRGFAKLICLKNDNDRIIGLHLISPNSGEAIHGLSLACSLGATKSDFDARVLGIHPTDAEALTDMTVTKSSGESYRVAAGCGGGKCG